MIEFMGNSYESYRDFYGSPEYLQIEPVALKTLQDMAVPHVEKSMGRISLLDRQPSKYPGQRGFIVQSDHRQPYENTEALATMTVPGFPKLVENMIFDEASWRALQRAHEHVKARDNIIVATNHGELADIAISLIAVQGGLNFVEATRNTDADVRSIKSGIVIGKMISMVGYHLDSLNKDMEVPAVQALKLVCDDVFLTFPQTPSTRDKAAAIGSEYMNFHNKAVKQNINDRLSAGGYLLAVAPSGTTDKPRETGGEIVMDRVGRGTRNIMMSDNTYVLPLAAWFADQENPVLEIVEYPQKLNSDEEIDECMSHISEKLNETVEGKTFRYER